MFGPWRVVELLDEGAWAYTVLARHEASGRLGAVKAVRAGRGGAAAQLEREIRALQGLEHPGIVSLIDHQSTGPQPWYAMEYLAARPIRALAPAPPRQAVRLVRSLCEPLAYLHQHGLVVGDLTGDNTLVRPDGTVCLIGLTSLSRTALGRDVLDSAGYARGLSPYAAPEQLRGDLVDARADLYAVGCLFYELLTGSPPVVGSVPEAPSHLAPKVPPALDKIVLTLLEERRERRPPYAWDLHRVLCRLLREPAPDPPTSTWYLYRPRIAGRTAELDAIGAALAGLWTSGAMFVVTGDLGVGKTRLAAEAASLAAREQVRVVVGHGEAGGGTLHPFRRLARLVVDLVEDQPGAIPAGTLRLLEEVEPEFGRFASDAPAPVPVPPEAARYRLFLAMSEVLGALTRVQPLVVVLDDIHEADELSLGFLRFLADGPLARMKMLVIATSQLPLSGGDPGQGGAGSGVPPTLKRLLNTARRLDLDRVGDAQIGAMVADMLAMPSPPPRLARFVARHTSGNASFVSEFLRAAIDEGVLQRRPGRGWVLTEGWESHDLPTSMRSLVWRRLVRLPWHARAIVDAAAVLGRTVPLDLLAPLTGLAEGFLLGGVATLLREHILEEDTAGTLRFADAEVRAVAYERLSDDRRRSLHRAAALAMEAEPTTWADRLAELGHHWEQGERHGRAHGVYLAGARAAAARYAHDEAERLYHASLLLTRSPAERLAPRLELGELLAEQGRPRDARRALRAGIADALAAGDPGAEALGTLVLGRVEHELGEVEQAWSLLERARAIARDIADAAIEGRATARLAAVCHTRGDHRAARSLYEEAIGLARRASDPRALGETLDDYAMLLHDQIGDADSAAALLREALVLHHEVGNKRAEAHTLAHLANVHHQRGELGPARGLYGQALDLAREVGDITFEAIIATNEAAVWRDEGRIPDAERAFEEALDLHRRMGSRHTAAMVLCEIAALRRIAHGDLDGAGMLLDEAEDALVQVGDDVWQGLVQCQRGHLALARGGSAEPFLSRAIAIGTRLGGGVAGRLGRAVDRLRRAVHAPRLVRGERLVELEPGYRRWVRDHH